MLASLASCGDATLGSGLHGMLEWNAAMPALQAALCMCMLRCHCLRCLQGSGCRLPAHAAIDVLDLCSPRARCLRDVRAMGTVAVCRSPHLCLLGAAGDQFCFVLAGVLGSRRYDKWLV